MHNCWGSNSKCPFIPKKKKRKRKIKVPLNLKKIKKFIFNEVGDCIGFRYV